MKKKPRYEDLNPEARDAALEKLGRLNRLYDLFGTPPDEKYPIVIRANSRTKKPWNYFPDKHVAARPDAAEFHLWELKKDIVANLAISDPRWALGGSKRNHPASPVFQYELDYEMEPGQTVDEEFAMERLNMPLYDFLRKKGCTPHLILTGNRSIHVGFYNQIALRKDTWLCFFDSIKQKLILGGKIDAILCAGAGMRYPFSRHHKTGNLCRYLGNLTELDVLSTLDEIRKDNLSDFDLVSISSTVDSEFQYPDGIAVSILGMEIHLSSKELKKRKNLVEIDHRREKTLALIESSFDSEPDSEPTHNLKSDMGTIQKAFSKTEHVAVVSVLDTDVTEEESEMVKDEHVDDGFIAIFPFPLPSPPIDIIGAKVNPSDYANNAIIAIIPSLLPPSLPIDIKRSKVESSEYLDNGIISINPSSSSTPSLPIDIKRSKVDQLDVEESQVEHFDFNGQGDSWSNSLPRKEEYEEYLSDGLPKGISTEVLLKSEFFKYVCHKFNSSEEAFRVISDVIQVGVDRNTFNERLQRLQYIRDKVNFNPRSIGKASEIDLSDEEQQWLVKFREYMEQNGRLYRESTRQGYLTTAEYIFKQCRRFAKEGAAIGSSDLVREFGWSKQTAYNRISVFRKEFIILRLVTPHKPKVLRTEYMRVPVLNFDFAQQAEWFKTRSKTERESMAGLLGAQAFTEPEETKEEPPAEATEQEVIEEKEKKVVEETEKEIGFAEFLGF